MNLSDGLDQTGISLYEYTRLNLPISSNEKNYCFSQHLAEFHIHVYSFEKHDLSNATKIWYHTLKTFTVIVRLCLFRMSER